MTAIKVDVIRFGSHLEAYATTLPIVLTLRKCNRFGRGAAITKLPMDLIRLIEDIIVLEARPRYQDLWKKRYRCAMSPQCVCDAEACLYHYEEKHWNDTYKASVAQSGFTCQSCEEAGKTPLQMLNIHVWTADFRECSSQLLAMMKRETLDAHSDTRSKWRQGVLRNSLFEDIETFRSCFALDTWLALNTNEQKHESTDLFLVPRSEDNKELQVSGPQDLSNLKDGACMTTHLRALQSNESLLHGIQRRLKHACNVLDLEPLAIEHRDHCFRAN